MRLLLFDNFDKKISRVSCLCAILFLKMKPKKINKLKLKENAYKGKYTVVKFIEVGDKLFECIPDIWFVDEDKTSCFWPPKTGKSFTLRALTGETPDDSYSIHACEVISEDHRKFLIFFSFKRL